MIYLYEYFKDDPNFDTKVYVDGKLCHSITNAYLEILQGEEKEYFREVLNWKNFIYVRDYQDSLSVATNNEKLLSLVVVCILKGEY